MNKNTVWIIALVVIAMAALLGLIFGIAWVSATNREVSLRNATTAQEKANEASFDAMWKIISGKAEVADEYKNSFKEIYGDIISGRYKDNNLLFKFITEHNPKFSTALYKQLASSIEGERKRFLLGQEKLIDLKRQHDDLRQRWPSRWFVGDRPELQITVVTSDKTDDAFRSGKEEPEPMFPRNKKEAKK